MEPVIPNGHKSPFSRLNKPRSSQLALWSKQSIVKIKRSPKQTLTMEPIGHDGQNNLFSRSNDPRSSSPNFSWMFVKILDMDPVVPTAKTDSFSRSNDPRSR
ncbi:hypothetical protein H5410_052980 [Solanum commersonii]|uniref:Uncharacterized protein n=1 Tax=Solanum commersonii TaxID=4109 RepID=A0A9J5X2A1_SOLCO|nr:hypothetical protein H5410_052980 [Solanum commersonii]